jgi:hypothetical protein
MSRVLVVPEPKTCPRASLVRGGAKHDETPLGSVTSGVSSLSVERWRVTNTPIRRHQLYRSRGQRFQASLVFGGAISRMNVSLGLGRAPSGCQIMISSRRSRASCR